MSTMLPLKLKRKKKKSTERRMLNKAAPQIKTRMQCRAIVSSDFNAGCKSIKQVQGVNPNLSPQNPHPTKEKQAASSQDTLPTLHSAGLNRLIARSEANYADNNKPGPINTSTLDVGTNSSR